MRLVLDIQGSHAHGFWEDEHGERKAAYVTTLGIDQRRDDLYRRNVSTMRLSVELVMSDLEVATRTAWAGEGLGISPEPAIPAHSSREQLIIEALETTEGRVALSQAMVEPMLRVAGIYRTVAAEINEEMIAGRQQRTESVVASVPEPEPSKLDPIPLTRWDMLP